MTPGENSSGARRRQGGITKAGNVHARRLLVEAAWCYRFAPRVTAHLERKARDASPRARDIAWKAQCRLCGKFRRLTLKGKNPKAVCIAVGRELAGFVQRLPERVILGEVQRAPAIFSSLKLEIDRRRIPGRFLLTGSTQVLLVPKMSDSLAGRMQKLHLHPLAQCELERAEPNFLNVLFEGRFSDESGDRLGLSLATRIAAGGYPEALTVPQGTQRIKWYQGYVDALIQRDVRDLGRIDMLDLMPRIMQLAASQTAEPFNINALANTLRTNWTNVRTYLTFLERVFLLERLDPWCNSDYKRLILKPKLHLCDTGLACALLHADASELDADRVRLGHLLETFAYQELKRQAGWHDAPLRFSYFRDKDDYEVDVVIERGMNAVAGIETKAAASVNAADFRGLRKLAEIAGSRFVCGVLLYDGEFSASFGDKLYAVPIRKLWERGGAENPRSP